MSTRRKSPLKELIKESISDLRNGEFPEDPKLEDQQLSGPERFVQGQKKKDEVVIDSLLSDLAGQTGYFVKLKKEVRPNEWMLMKVIENEWRRWADMESAVADIVKEHTKKSPQKWGSGLYRVEIACKGGMRGRPYDPIDIHVNAEEEFLNPQNGSIVNGASVVDPSVQVTSTLDMISQLMNAVKGVIPAPVNPADIQNQISQAFQQGMSMKVNDGNTNTQMMTVLMTGMMGMMKELAMSRNDSAKVVNTEESFASSMTKMLGVLKDFGVIGNNNGNSREKTAIDFAKELQALGLDLFKKEEPIEQINRLKQIASIVSDFTGMSGSPERPSILEKIVDVLGPAVPKMIQDIKDTATQAANAQAIAAQNIERVSKRMPVKQMQQTQVIEEKRAEEMTTYQKVSGSGSGKVVENNGNMSSGSMSGEPQETAMNEQVKVFFGQLYDSVKSNNRMFYPIVYTSLVQDQQGVELIQGIVSGSKNAKDVINLLQQYGDGRFRESEFVMKFLISYVNGFIVWIKQMVGQSHNQEQVQESSNGRVQERVNGFDVICPVCKTEYMFESEQDFLEDDKVCETKGCHGIVEPMGQRAV